MTVLNEAAAVRLGTAAATRVYAGPSKVWPPGVSYRDTIMGTPGLVGYWRLGEANTSLPMVDERGVHTGDYANAPTLGVAGAIVGDANTAMDTGAGGGGIGVVRGPLRDFIGERVDPRAVGPLDLGDGPLTIEAWIGNLLVVGGGRGIVTKGGGAYYLRLNGSGQLNFLKSQTADMGSSTVAVPTGAGWHHVVATKSGAAVKLYIDGVDRTGSITNATLANNDSLFFIGAENAGGFSTEPLKGSIDEVAIYSAVLTPAQVLEHYNAGIGASPPAFVPSDIVGLALWLDASQLGLASGAPVEVWPDLSGNTGRNLICDPATHPGAQPSYTGGVVHWGGGFKFLWTPTTRYTIGHYIVVGRWTGAATFPEYNGMISGQTEIVLIGNAGAATFYPPYPNPVMSYYYNGVGGVWTAPMGAWAVMSLATVNPGTGPVLGVDRFTAGREWLGDIAEVVAYDHVLTDPERIQVETYLADKWGIAMTRPGPDPTPAPPVPSPHGPPPE